MIRTAVLVAATLLVIPCQVPAADADSGFQWVDHPELGTTDLTYAGKPALRYMYAFDTSTPERKLDTFKVYHHVFGPGTGGPGTGTLITKGPGGLYTHHRGLFVGWMHTRFEGKRLDFWHGKEGAHQRHVRFLNLSADKQSATMSSEIHWNDADGKPVITETRTVCIQNVGPAANAPAWQIDWSTKLKSNRGEIELAGDRQHAGFQFRSPQSVAAANAATYIRPAAYPQEPKAIEVNDSGDPPKHINLGWLAMRYPVEDAHYTVAYFEDPSLPKPSLFSERPYGRFGAYFKTTIAADMPLTMRYRLIVTAGAPPSRESIQSQYDAFVADLKRAPSK